VDGAISLQTRKELEPQPDGQMVAKREGHFAARKETLDKRRPPFSVQAANAWADRVAEFEFDLGELAMREAAREGDNFVSDHHVQRAAEFLITRSKDRVTQTLKDVGGVTMGTGAGALLACASTGIGGTWLAVSIVLTLVGTALFFRHGK
jgi:hypothetical protein